jgi:sialate O-acetylesterase
MLFVMVCVAGLNGAYAEVKLPPVLSSHMVLQRGVKVPIWGTAASGETVTVKFRDQEKSTTADAQGKWKVSLDSLQAGGPDVLTVTGSNTLTLEDVLVGEVWLGSGQSNMYGGADQYVMNDEVLTNMVAAGPYPKLRLIRLDSSAWTGWKEATPENLMTFSALLFSFGCPLQKDLNVPVGLLVGAVAGKPSGFFLSQEAFNSDPACQDLVNSDPTGVVGTTWYGVIGELYETIIRPGIPYAIRGVLWDQGESGTGIKGIDQYTVMGALIKGWRKDWGQPPTPHSAGSGQADSGLPGDFPFIYVQKWSGGGCAWDNTDPVTSKGESLLPLPSVYPDYPKLGFIDYLKIRNYTNTFMSTSSDLGSGMHPVNKSGYGARAARVALGGVYGKDVEIYGPVYNSQKIVGDKVIISFDHLGLGLAFKTNELVDKLQGFRISGDAETYNYNRPRFVWADAVIEGDTVVVSSALVPNPVAVRWAWLDDRRWANLFNLDGLPALPFSTYGIPAPQQLLLSLPAVATEGDGVLVGNGSVTLSAVQETNAVVTLASLNTGKVTVPASVTILAGQLSATFDVTIVDDTVMNGPQTAIITATARGLGLDAGGISVQDNDSGVMVTAPPITTEGVGTIQGTVTISDAQTVPVTVELSSSDTTAVQVPAGVVIPAGQTSAPFTITVVDDNKIDGTQTATLTARVQGWRDGNASIAVLDNVLSALTWGGNGNGIWTNPDEDGDWQAATYTNGDNVTFNDTATGTIIVSGGTVNPGNITVNSTNKNYITSIP